MKRPGSKSGNRQITLQCSRGSHFSFNKGTLISSFVNHITPCKCSCFIMKVFAEWGLLHRDSDAPRVWAPQVRVLPYLTVWQDCYVWTVALAALANTPDCPSTSCCRNELDLASVWLSCEPLFSISAASDVRACVWACRISLAKRTKALHFVRVFDCLQRCSFTKVRQVRGHFWLIAHGIKMFTKWIQNG